MDDGTERLVDLFKVARSLSKLAAGNRQRSLTRTVVCGREFSFRHDVARHNIPCAIHK